MRPVSTEHPNLTAQRDALGALGVGDHRIYDHCLTANRDRSGLQLPLATYRTDSITAAILDGRAWRLLRTQLTERAFTQLSEQPAHGSFSGSGLRQLS